MKKFFLRFEPVYNRLIDIQDRLMERFNIPDLDLSKFKNIKINKRFTNNFINKRRFINFLQTNMLLFLAILLFALFMRPLSLDFAEIHKRSGIGDEKIDILDNIYLTQDDVYEEDILFPFEIVKPIEGLDRHLTRAEMRWIFKEEIRLNAMKHAIDFGNERAHRAFSIMVQDFNLRGANFKYELHEKNRAREDIEFFREEIEKNAMDEAKNNGWGQL